MDYEKKYKESLEKAHKLCAYPTTKPFISDLQDLFPELAENEDEKIRKELTDFVKSRLAGFPKCKRFTDWLEKHGKNNMGISEATKQKLEDSLNKALEKETPESFNKFLDEQGEKKPADKVEPNFHEDDWIVNKGHSYLIGYIDYEQRRYLFEIGGYTHEQLNWEYIENADNKYHLWTIQDAKDGDVLCCESGWTCIFKALNSDISFSSYCFMDNTGWFCETGSEAHTLDKAFIMAYNGNIYPATKEQRDLLFQKMKEAGYEWDAEKKELKKIEFNQDDLIEESYQQQADDIINMVTEKPAWSEEDDKKAERIIRLLQEAYDINCINGSIDWLKSLKPQLKQEWSEEDENMFRKAIITIDNVRMDTDSQEYYQGICDWLKSLKDRVQPKQEWSEEDKNMLQSIFDEYKSMPTEKRNWLKSFKNRYTWKPSEEQMEALKEACNEHWEPDGLNPLYTLYQNLKKLKGE